MKFPKFQELTDCLNICESFLTVYDNLPRNSGVCYELWLNIVRGVACIKYIESEIKENFSFSLQGFLPQKILKERSDEIKNYLKPLKQNFTAAFNFLNIFISIREPYLKNDFGENKRVARKMNKYLKSHQMRESQLTKVLVDYQNFLRNNLENEVEKHKFDTYVQELISSKEKERLVLPGTLALVSDLINRLRQPDKSVDWKRVELLIPVVEDILKSVRLKDLKLLVTKAKQRLGQNSKFNRRSVGRPGIPGVPWKKNRDRESLVIEDAVTPGLHELGPFGIHPLSDAVSFSFEFNLLNENFSLNLSELSGQNRTESFQEVEVVKGKISPRGEITIQDEQTFTKMKIPPMSTSFAFVYPLDMNQLSGVNFELPQGLESLIENGGYVYFNKDDGVTQINSLVVGGADLFFEGPYLVAKHHQHKVVELDSKGRWGEVTVEGLVKSGAKKFAWLNPGEFGKGHGCFLYSYFDETWPMTYFDVVNVNRAKLRRPDSSSKLQQLLTTYTLRL